MLAVHRQVFWAPGPPARTHSRGHLEHLEPRPFCAEIFRPRKFFLPCWAPTNPDSTLTTATPSVDKSCSFKDLTATKSAQVQSVAACATAVGDITVKGDAFGTIELTGLEQLYGSLQVINATQATSLNAPTLQLVSEQLSLSGNTILNTLNLAQLTTVGTLHFNALPALEKTGLNSGITTADEVIISDTGLTSLDGINVFKLKTFDVNNNKDIETIDSGLQSVTDTLSIAYNSEKVDVILDQLTLAKSLSFQSINSLSVANLTKITGSLSFDSNSLDKIEFKQLQVIGNSLTILKNDNLEEIDFPKVKSIGGALIISKNDDLRSFDGLPKLQTIDGSVNLKGKFDNGTFESLKRVAGGFNLDSTGDLTCKEFTKLNKDGDIKGDKFVCKAAGESSSSSSSKKGNSNGTNTDDSSSTDDSGSGSGSSSSTKKKNDANSASLSLASMVLGFVALGATLF